MKLLKTVSLAILFAMLSTSMLAQSEKFGHVNATLVMTMMPEYTKAMKQLQKLDSTYNIELEKLAVEINRKIEDYNNDTLSPPLIRESKVAEIQELQMRAQQFQQRIEQDMQQQQMQMIRPISNKIIEAINSIAKEKELIYVFDISSGNPVYVSDKSLDLVPILFERFGIEYDPNALQQQQGQPMMQ